jgi:hypothetical protein
MAARDRYEDNGSVPLFGTRLVFCARTSPTQYRLFF